MDWSSAVSLGVPAVIVVCGWFFAHRLTAQRELAARRREARLKALEAAYMRLATSSNRPVTAETREKLEMFVSEIQLYGTPKQIELMVEIVKSYIKAAPTISFDPILTDLRNTIREELRLEPVQGSIWWLRLGPPAQPSPSIQLSEESLASKTPSAVGPGEA
jgi:hypothetical protein